MSEPTKDDELDALFRRAEEQMLSALDARIDIKAALAEVMRRAGVEAQPYADDSSSAGEVTDRKETREDL